MITSDYTYELRDGDRIIATGHLNHPKKLQAGDQIEIGGSAGIVREVIPILGQNGVRVVVDLSQTAV